VGGYFEKIHIPQEQPAYHQLDHIRVCENHNHRRLEITFSSYITRAHTHTHTHTHTDTGDYRLIIA
jgi:hypothetical protein